MKKPKEEYHAKDRLSELPESLIIDILGLLPLTDVVRTTVLSKHWKNMWTTIPWLDFDFDFEDSRMENKDKFREFVHGALRSWRGTKILRFKIFIFDYEVVKSLTNDDIGWWVRFAVEKDVEELELLIPFPRGNVVNKLYSVAQDLYSCSSLKELGLHLVNCNLQIHGNVQWDRLESLSISSGCIISDEAMDKVLRGSPRLESLSLFLNKDNAGSFSIRSTSLKRLSFYMHSTTLRGSKLRMELRISTPNLEYLILSGNSYNKYLLMNNMPSLSEAILEYLEGPHNFVEEMLTQILPVIKHVERVSLSDACIEVLGGMKEKPIISSFPNANSLELIVCQERYEQIVDVLQMFPQLHHLLLNTSYGKQKEAKSSFDFDGNLPSSFLLKLRTIEVATFNGDVSIIPLIQILLKYASNLEELVFLEGGSWPRKILLKVQRSSPDEELIFDHTKLCLLQSKDAS